MADSLTVFEPARTIIAKDNPAIVKIPISQMQCGLNQHCELFNIGIKKWSPGYLDKSISYIKREYDSKYLCNENINERYYGRTALYKLLEGIEGTDWSGLNSTTFSSHFQFHLVASRHRILLEAIKRQGGWNEKLCECLHNNLKLWERVAALDYLLTMFTIVKYTQQIVFCFILSKRT